MTIGTLVSLGAEIGKSFGELREMGLGYCQVCGWNDAMYTDEMAETVLAAAKENEIKITTYWCGWPGPAVWDFYEGPATLGLVPEAYRFRRLEALLAGSDFAKKINVRQMATHAGFIPENPSTNEYAGVLAALRVVVKRCADNSQSFLFETGQETPVTLLRVIEDLGGENVGINLDPANLLMYGKANPVDALDVFGKYVRDVHAKDGEYPVGGRFLGEEKPLGSGRVNFPAFIKKLKTIGYDGPITIEREISGEKQRQDILKAISTLKELIG